MKRRHLSIGIASGLMTLPILAACTTAAPTPTPVAVLAPTAAKPKGTYYFLAGNNSDPFYAPGVKGFKDACAEAGVPGEFVGPMDLNLAEHVKIFEQLNASPETLGIFLYPWDANAQTPLILEAKGKGIPLVVGAADMLGKQRDAFIGYDNNLLGEQAAAWVIKALGKGKVGSLSNKGANAVQRQDAFGAALKKAGFTVVERGLHDGSADSAIKAVDAYLVANKDLDLLWFADGTASQMVQPWKERQQSGAKVKFLATDMPTATLQAVKDGIFAASVGQDTYTEAYWGVKLLDGIRAKKRVPDTVFLSVVMVEKGNADQFVTK